MTELDDALNPGKFKVEQILELEKEYMVPAVAHYYKNPKLFIRGKGASLFDSDDKEYIDLFAGICTVLSGYSHPKLISALKKQLDLLMHTSTLYPTVPMALYAKKLATVMPRGLNKCFFLNSGSEANEAALHLTKIHKKSSFIISLDESFHGRTLMSMSITNQGVWRHNIAYAADVIGVPNANCYRCCFGKTSENCDMECARYVEKAIRCRTPNRIAGLIAEPIQGNGGVIVPPPDYFPMLIEIVHKYDGLFISDEVQTGFGRTGKKMWGIEHWGIIPDIITMAKGIGSGFPMGAFVTKKEVAEALKPKDLFSTFGGNPLAMVAGLANLEIIEEEKFLEQAAEKGTYLLKRLNELSEKHKLIGDVRGKGLMIGVELVKDRKTKVPATVEAQTLLNLTLEKGVLLGLGGLDSNVIRIKPPIVITKSQLDKAIMVIDESLSQIEKG